MSILEKYENFFLDRDGIINEVVMRGSVVSSPRNIAEFVFKDQIKEFIHELSNRNKRIFIVSNQPDIARGKLLKSDLQKMSNLIRDQLGINDISYCIHDDSDNCECRKPKPGMIEAKIKKLNLCREDCVMIGDSYKDVYAAINAGIDSFYLKTSYNEYKKNVQCFYINSLIDII